tara:strand:+ start:334 stop:618 length:285 start_codon:yes stop_codon:yes gene_type:complete
MGRDGDKIGEEIETKIDFKREHFLRSISLRSHNFSLFMFVPSYLNILFPLFISSRFNLFISFKELGDVENWAGTVEDDMRTITTILEYVHKHEQ